jgi:hypothetical protein
MVIAALIEEDSVGFAARLAPYVIPQCGDLIAISKSIYGRLSSGEKHAFAVAIICRLACQAPLEHMDAMNEAIELVSVDLSPASILSLIGSLNLDGTRLSYIYITIEGLTSSLKFQFVSEPWLLAKPVVDRGRLELSDEGIIAFSRLLTLSASSSPSEFNSCAWKLLSIAMEAQDRLASPLLSLIFPYVYEQLRRNSTFGEVFAGWLFNDWDKCKTARKRLVRAFMRSAWPPSDLVKIAIEIGDIDRIFRRALKEPRGSAYLQRIEQDLHAFPDATRATIERALKDAWSWGNYISDVDT